MCSQAESTGDICFVEVVIGVLSITWVVGVNLGRRFVLLVFAELRGGCGLAARRLIDRQR